MNDATETSVTDIMSGEKMKLGCMVAPAVKQRLDAICVRQSRSMASVLAEVANVAMFPELAEGALLTKKAPHTTEPLPERNPY